MTRPNGTTRWIAILLSAVVATVGFTWAAATDSMEAVNDSVAVVVADLEKTEIRVNQLERDSTAITTTLALLLERLERMEKKIDKALGM